MARQFFYWSALHIPDLDLAAHPAGRDEACKPTIPQRWVSEAALMAKKIPTAPFSMQASQLLLAFMCVLLGVAPILVDDAPKCLKTLRLLEGDDGGED